MFKASLMALVMMTGATAATAQSTNPATSPAVSDSWVLTATGDGPWSIWCDYESRSGDMKREITPGKDHTGTLGVPQLRSGACHYTGNRGPMTIKITSDSWACPFKVAADAKCEQTFPRFASGEFWLSRRTATSR